MKLEQVNKYASDYILNKHMSRTSGIYDCRNDICIEILGEIYKQK